MKGDSRRDFIKKIVSIGTAICGFPLLKLKAQTQMTSSNQLPIILCSHGYAEGQKVLTPGWEILSADGNVLDAVEKSTNVAELNPDDTSVGYGGIPNEQGVVELDASVMYGPTHNCGAVAALQHIKTPSSVARLVMERTDHIMLVGKGALAFALAHGFKKENLLTERARLEWLRWKENLSDMDDWLPPQDGIYHRTNRQTGTINVLAVDRKGNIAGITSTSGLSFKMSGRVGDSPIIGAGLYVDNEVGAAGATGRGEDVIRTCGCFLVVEMMRKGLSPQKACEEGCLRIIAVNNGIENVIRKKFNVKFVAVNKNGEVGCAAIRGLKKDPPHLALINSTGFHSYSGTFIIEKLD